VEPLFELALSYFGIVSINFPSEGDLYWFWARGETLLTNFSFSPHLSVMKSFYSRILPHSKWAILCRTVPGRRHLLYAQKLKGMLILASLEFLLEQISDYKNPGKY
jgi:hypothetical protein